MAKIYFEAWVAWERTGSGHITFRVRKQHLDSLREALRRLKKTEMKRGPLLLENRLEIHHRKRSNPQNALMWALLEIVANEHNAGLPTDASMRDSEYFYRLFLQRYAPREKAHTGEEIIKTSSHFNTLEMSEFIERIFDELAVMDIGVTNPVEISSYWEQHKTHMRDKKVILNADIEFTPAQYKASVKLCEACAAPVWHEDIGSSLAHIKSVGMGGGREATVRGDEVMHLCDTCHALFDNGKGRAHFLGKYPHLCYKVKQALGEEDGNTGEERFPKHDDAAERQDEPGSRGDDDFGGGRVGRGAELELF